MTLVRRKVAEALGLKPIAKWVGSAVVGVPPKIIGAFPRSRVDEMGRRLARWTGVGPAFAVSALFERFGITKDDVDIFELNEGASFLESRANHSS
jgi:acetyl-CoA acyltransferase 1